MIRALTIKPLKKRRRERELLPKRNCTVITSSPSPEVIKVVSLLVQNYVGVLVRDDTLQGHLLNLLILMGEQLNNR